MITALQFLVDLNSFPNPLTPDERLELVELLFPSRKRSLSAWRNVDNDPEYLPTDYYFQTHGSSALHEGLCQLYNDLD